MTDFCPHCEEPIGPLDRTDKITTVGKDGTAHLASWHWECAARSVLGSVGHLQRRCSCYGGEEEDPPGATKREAARASLRLYLEQSRARRATAAES